MAVKIIDRQKTTGVDRRLIRRIVARILADHDCPDADLTVTLSDDAFIRELNRTYRNSDRPTDVLAFAMLEGPGPVVEGEGPEAILGDVVISAERASVQARRYRRTLERETMKLVSHGVLHLLGYDHEKSKERTEMRALENGYVRQLYQERHDRAARRRTKA